ncbi:hypothetical protein BC422P2_00038 [Bacteroides phage BC422P2]|nr:hypothetical protein BC422P2_00038 [Bacteroides phage BC422P2]WAX07668.1 hypothetical protein BK687P1_00039 [Bacteroides phage BK687P1]
MGCLNKLNKAILVDCDGGATGVAEMLLINFSDISFKSIANSVANVDLVSGAKAVLVESNKKGVNATEEIKENDNAPTALTQAVTFTLYQGGVNGTAIVNQILNGTFLALVKTKAGRIRAYGYNYGLNPTAISEDLNANGGFTTITLSTSENVIGEARLNFADASYNTLRAAAIVTE